MLRTQQAYEPRPNRRSLPVRLLMGPTDPDDHVVGYVVVDIIDGHAHIEQVSFEPIHLRTPPPLNESRVPGHRLMGCPELHLCLRVAAEPTVGPTYLDVAGGNSRFAGVAVLHVD